MHGGSGIAFGVIEQLREQMRAQLPGNREEPPFLELVHRLDRETSGVLLLAKKRAALVAMHALLRDGRTDKRYLTLVRGRWPHLRRGAGVSLHKFVTRRRRAARACRCRRPGRGRRFSRASRCGGEATLLEARLKTGRTHQIRVHLAHEKFPIAGDDKYGDFEWNRHAGEVRA